MSKVIQNDVTLEYIKTLDPLEYVDAESEAMVFLDERGKQGY